jgi:cation/acetate symporter
VPVAHGTPVRRGSEWARPITRGGTTSPLFVYSLLIATVLGTMGLPHILVRFYTNPDGEAARRTTVRVLGLLGLFYLFPVVYGLLGRAVAPQLYVTGHTDSVVLQLPQIAWPGLGGEILGGLTAAGAFAAFMSTSSGLLVSVAGTTAHDLWRRPGEGRSADRRRRFRAAAMAGMVVPCALALVARSIEISVLVGWAFALAASTFCPMFLLGIWWPRLTSRGAAAGMLAGAVIATAGIVASLLTGVLEGGLGALLTQPAVVSVPIAFATMVGVSLLDARRPPAVEASMRALHAPEGIGFEEAVRGEPGRRPVPQPA